MNTEQFTPGTDIEAIQLKEHIASGAKSLWFIYIDKQSPSGAAYQYNSYEKANEVFDMTDDTHYVDLVLFTHIGTAVMFRHKEPEHVT